MLELWERIMDAIAPTPFPGDVYRMYWNGEWRYYQHLAFSYINGKIWDRVTKNDYEEYRKVVAKTKNITLEDLLQKCPTS